MLVALHGAPNNAQNLSTALGAYMSSVHAVLRRLRDPSVVVVQPVPRAASLWRLAGGVRLTYRPVSVVVEGATPLPLPPPGNRRGAAVTRGRACRMRAVSAGRCFLHQARPNR